MSGSLASPAQPGSMARTPTVDAGPGQPCSPAVAAASGGVAAVPAERWQQRVRAGGHDWHLDRYRGAAPATAGETDATHRPLCVLLHGTGASAASWDALAPLLAQRFDIVAPDLPAHARTHTPRTAPLDIDAQATALQALLDTLACEPDVLIGHSAGAVIAAAWALQRARASTADGAPRSGGPRIVTLNGALLPLEGPAGWVFQPLARLSSGLDWLPRLFALRAEREPDHVRRMLRATGSSIDDAMVERYRPLLADGDHVAGVLRMMAEWDLKGFARRLAGLRAPLHLFAGDADRTIPLRHAHRLRSLLPDATLDVLPGLGHLAHEEAPVSVAAAMLDRLDHPDARR